MPRYYISAPPSNPLSRIFAAVFAILLIVGAVVFGVFVFAVIAAVGIISWIGLSVRRWWLRRKGVEQPPSGAPNRPTDSSNVIDAEYTVISRRRE